MLALVSFDFLIMIAMSFPISMHGRAYSCTCLSHPLLFFVAAIHHATNAGAAVRDARPGFSRDGRRMERAAGGVGPVFTGHLWEAGKLSKPFQKNKRNIRMLVHYFQKILSSFFL